MFVLTILKDAMAIYVLLMITLVTYTIRYEYVTKTCKCLTFLWNPYDCLTCPEMRFPAVQGKCSASSSELNRP